MSYNIYSMTIGQKILLAFKVIGRWEVLISIIAFFIILAFVNFISDPWRNENKRQLYLQKIARKKAEQAALIAAENAKKQALAEAKQKKKPNITDEDEEDDFV